MSPQSKPLQRALYHPGTLWLWISAIASPTQATVYEYGSGAAVTVHGDEQADETPGALSQVPSVDRSEYRLLAESVALQHAGSAGVRAAGLDGLSFVRLFSAMIEVESGFNPRAVSSAGARGLGQLMPETAVTLGVVDSFDPIANLNGAAVYLTDQLDRFRDVRLALAAYNAGPDRIMEYGGIPPFPETQAYVRAVLDRAGFESSMPTMATTELPAGSLSPPGSGEPTSQQEEWSVWEFGVSRRESEPSLRQ